MYNAHTMALMSTNGALKGSRCSKEATDTSLTVTRWSYTMSHYVVSSFSGPFSAPFSAPFSTRLVASLAFSQNSYLMVHKAGKTCIMADTLQINLHNNKILLYTMSLCTTLNAGSLPFFPLNFFSWLAYWGTVATASSHDCSPTSATNCSLTAFVSFVSLAVANASSMEMILL